MSSPTRPRWSALANIIANAVESYTDAMGPVKITVEPRESDILIQISDLGCGMNAETLRKKAATPSSPPNPPAANAAWACPSPSASSSSTAAP